jgi:hypothetical protein
MQLLCTPITGGARNMNPRTPAQNRSPLHGARPTARIFDMSSLPPDKSMRDLKLYYNHNRGTVQATRVEIYGGAR